MVYILKKLLAHYVKEIESSQRRKEGEMKNERGDSGSISMTRCLYEPGCFISWLTALIEMPHLRASVVFFYNNVYLVARYYLNGVDAFRLKLWFDPKTRQQFSKADASAEAAAAEQGEEVLVVGGNKALASPPPSAI